MFIDFTKKALSYVAFPGLGIEEFAVNRIAFTLNIGNNSIDVYWYGLIITLGIVAAFAYACYRGYSEGVTVDDCIDIAIFTVIVGVIGARLYYVFTKFENFKADKFIETLKNIVNVRDGGLGIYGGIICGCIALVTTCLVKKINPLKVTDMAAPGVMLAQAIGRWGNFCNGEAYGRIVEEGSPLYFIRMGLLSVNTVFDFGIDMVYVHPTFLYESLWNIIGFTFITLLYKKKKFNGQIACMYLAWYGFGRMFIEGLRTDSLYVGIFRISQLVGLACFVIFGGLLIWGLIRSRNYNTEGFVPANKFEGFLIPNLISFKEGLAKEKAEKEAAKLAKKEKKDGKDN